MSLTLFVVMLILSFGKVSRSSIRHAATATLAHSNSTFATVLFAPALTLDPDYKHFTLDVSKDRLKNAPGFDKNSWPNMSDQTWAKGVHAYHGTTPPEAVRLLRTLCLPRTKGIALFVFLTVLVRKLPLTFCVKNGLNIVIGVKPTITRRAIPDL